jgi:hypothetical protein
MICTIKNLALVSAIFVLGSCDKDDPAPNSLGGDPGNCTGVTVAGNYSIGKILTASNTVTIQANVNTTGSYSISTNTVNGMTFSGTGTFSTTGTQNVVLTGTGTPTGSGTQNFTITYNASTCTFSLPISPDITFTTTLTGANERPTPNASTATGSSTLVFNSETKIFTVTTTYNGLTGGTVSGAHIHKGDATIAGPVIFGFGAAATLASPIVYTSVAITAAQEADLMAGLWYVNVHSTPTYPGGEIRGQLIKQ